MSEMAPEALVPEWHVEPHTCPNGCGSQWHSLPAGDCVSSCLNQIIIPKPRMPLLWDGDCA